MMFNNIIRVWKAVLLTPVIAVNSGQNFNLQPSTPCLHILKGHKYFTHLPDASASKLYWRPPSKSRAFLDKLKLKIDLRTSLLDRN